MKTRRIPKITKQWLALFVVFTLVGWPQIVGASANRNDQLLEAARRGDLAAAETLLQKGIEVNGRGWVGRKALMHAAEQDKLDVVRLLLDKGADADAKDEQDRTPLMYAAAAGNLEVAKLLIERGANVKARSEDKSTALIEAAGGNHGTIKNDHVQIAELLVQHGADVNARTNSGATALLRAAWAKHGTDMVKFLLNNGADVNAKDERGRTALLEAVSGWNYWGQDFDLLELLLDKGADVNAKTFEGKTALMEAAAGDHQLDLRNWYEVFWDRLQYQLWGKKWGPMYPPGARTPEAVKLLLQRGANVNAKDQRGWTALKRAQYSTAPLASAVVELLKSHGAK